MEITNTHPTSTGRAPDYAHSFRPATQPQRGGDLVREPSYGFSPLRTGGLTKDTIASLRATFSGYGHNPTPDMWEALNAIASTAEAMADGNCPPLVYLSSLDPGVGKTTVVIHFLRSLIASEAHRRVAALICVRTREKIEAFVAEAGLSKWDYAVLTSDARLNELGCCDPTKARVLFTTHSMVVSRCQFRSFSNVSEFCYNGSVREVRIWDEAILPGEALTVARDKLAHLFEPLRPRYPALAADIEALFNRLAQAKDGDVIFLEDLAEKHGVGLNEALRCVDGRPVGDVAAVESLWFLLGRHVAVRRDGRFGTTILDYRETPPDDIKPLLALDASARVRTLYRLWENCRGGLMMLPSATKDYSNHTIHVWDHAGGKSAFESKGDGLLAGIANAIRSKPHEEWLIVHHKNAMNHDFESAVRRLIPDNTAPVHFIHWGIHDATNEYAHVPNVILAGTLFLRVSQYESLGRLAAARPAASGHFPKRDLDEVMIGEHSHLILQAMCRGAVRRCVENGCPKTDTYLIASRSSGIAQGLHGIFPGATIVPWQPVAKPLSGKVAEAVQFIGARLAEHPDAVVVFAEVLAHLRWRSMRDFRRDIRQHPAFIEAIAAMGIEEWGKGKRCTGFRCVQN